MEIFWIAVGLFLLIVLGLCWRYDQRMKAQGRSLRHASDMRSDGFNLRLDARVAKDQAGWSRTATQYPTEQLAERAARRDRHRPT